MAVGRRQHARAGGGDGAARVLGTVVTRMEERGGKEQGLTDWHSGVGVRWLAQNHGMGDAELGLHGANGHGRRRCTLLVNEALGAAPDLVPLGGSDDTAMIRCWGPLSAVGCGDGVTAEAGWQEGL
jgi:hypothetical protein